MNQAIEHADGVVRRFAFIELRIECFDDPWRAEVALSDVRAAAAGTREAQRKQGTIEQRERHDGR
jgi:hypothetical protein